jgi:ribose-phosphate pyrophosphokinase
MTSEATPVEPLLLCFPEYIRQGSALAAAAGLRCAQVDVHHFPDEESRVILPPVLPERIFLLRSLDRPHGKLIELMLAAATARELGARHVTLVAPYLCYMRQDIAFRAGEGVSQRIVGRFLASFCDALISVDPHLHRTASLRQAVPVEPALSLSAAEILGRFVAQRVPGAFLLGPDEESARWVEGAARAGQLPHAIACKRRLGDRSVRIELPPTDFRGHQVVIVDDMASTGHTIAAVARALRGRGASAVYAAVTHALFARGAEREMRAAGVAEIWSTDSIPHTTNRVGLAELLATAVQTVLRTLGTSPPQGAAGAPSRLS